MEKIAEIKGIEFYFVENHTFKSDTVAVNFCDRLDRKRAYKNALLPALLWRGCESYPTSKELTVRCQELYGSIALNDVGKRSEIQHMMFMVDFLKEKYANACDGENGRSGISNLPQEAFKLLLDIITNPVTENGAFKEEYFQQECTNLNNDIYAEKNDKQHFAMRRCREVMCPDEAFGLSELGAAEDGESLTSKELYEYYREYFLKKISCKVFYCGSQKPVELIEMFKEAADKGVFGDGNRDTAYIEYVEKSVILPNEIKYLTEEAKISDGKLVMGFRTNTKQNSDEFFSIVVMNAVYGGSTSSKLFQNVREKNSLAYYAGSRISSAKGIMIVTAGISPDKYELATDIILEQLEEIKNGNVTDGEFDAAKKNVINNLRNLAEEQYSLLDYYLDQSFLERSLTIDEYIAGIEAVKKEQIIPVANRVQLDTVYFMKGTEEDDDDE